MPWASGSITGDLTPAASYQPAAYTPMQQAPAAGSEVAALHNKLDQLIAAYAQTPRGSTPPSPSIFAASAVAGPSQTPSPASSVGAAVSPQQATAFSPSVYSDDGSPAATNGSPAAAEPAGRPRAQRSVSFAAPANGHPESPNASSAGTAAPQRTEHETDDVGSDNAADAAATVSSLSSPALVASPSAQGSKSDAASVLASQRKTLSSAGSTRESGDAEPLASSAAPKRRSILKTALGRMMK